MSTSSLEIFSLRDSVVGEHRKFATSFATIFADDIRTQVEAIYAEGRFWPDPLIHINPNYKHGRELQALIDARALDPRIPDIFKSDGKPLRLWKHPEEAIALAAEGQSYVVTTGAGSGKSLHSSTVPQEKRRSAARPSKYANLGRCSSDTALRDRGIRAGKNRWPGRSASYRFADLQSIGAH